MTAIGEVRQEAPAASFSLEIASAHEQHLRVMAKTESTAYEYSLKIADETRADAGSREAIRAFKAWERRCLQIRLAQHVVGGFAAVVILIALVALFAEDGIPSQLARYLLIGSVALLVSALTLWDVIRLFPASRLTGKVLFDDGMKPFHDVRMKLVSGEEIAARQDGSRISAPLFTSPISLTAFSQDERVRGIRLRGSMRGLEFEPLIQTSLAEQESASGQVKLIRNVERLADKIERVEKSVNEQSQKTPPKRSAKAHWYSTVSEAMHKRRSPDIAARWNGYHQQQVQLAMDTAFALTRANRSPHITPGELKNEIAKTLKMARLPVGLGDRDSDSDVWIGQMFGKGNGHAYVYVRRYLTEPDFILQKELPLER